MKVEQKRKARYGHKIRKSRYDGRPEDIGPQIQLLAKSQRPVKSPLEHGETCSLHANVKMPVNSAWRR